MRDRLPLVYMQRLGESITRVVADASSYSECHLVIERVTISSQQWLRVYLRLLNFLTDAIAIFGCLEQPLFRSRFLTNMKNKLSQ